MSIGIMDQDLATYTRVVFNLEAMKLSAYYKGKGDIVVLAPTFTPDRHQTFIYRKDYEDGIYPKDLIQPNVQYGGLAFSNNVYQPLPIEIEKMRPDTSLYHRMEGTLSTTTRDKKIFNNLMNGEHCRLSLDGKNIWDRYGTQFKNLREAKNLIFHDYDLGKVQGAYTEVKAILARARTDGAATRVGMKFPVQVDNGPDLLDWSSLRTNSTFYSLQYNGIIDDDYFIKWVGACRERAIFKQVNYIVTASSYAENDFVMYELPRIFKQTIISRSYQVFFSLKYDEDFFTDPMWCKVLDLFNYYAHLGERDSTTTVLSYVPNSTLFDFAKSAKNELQYRRYAHFMTQDQIREVFAFVREKNYPLFKGFYEWTANNLGGIGND